MPDPNDRVTRKGRGAVSNPEGRFERQTRERFDDGWDQPDEELPPLATTVMPDPARTIISRNDSPDIPFTQSINPYRGCEHGCVYCMSGDTGILMADGSVKALADVRVGEELYGTVRNGWYRRYTRSRVLAHWRVIKPAYRITLEDGTDLVAGPDHRFLTERGWKYVMPGEPGKVQRPRLTTANKLMGTGAFAVAPVKGRDYQIGYLCGVIRGDGHLGEYRYQRAGRTNEHQYRFRLALCDVEALHRAQRYLSACGIGTQEFVFNHAAAGRRAMHAIRTSARRAVEDVRHVIAWPGEPSPTWAAGFLAGIFDAEGSYSQGILRISNTDEAIIARIVLCLRMLGFTFVIERIERSPGKTIQVVRLLGGLRAHLRFFHSVDPAITRRRDISGQAVKSNALLKVTGVEPIGRAMALYDITTETGDFIANGVVSHNCYARPSHAYLNLSPGLDFETKLFYKENAAALLERELRKPGYECSMISLGANTDPYQPVERQLKVTRSILEVLQRFRHPVGVVTKGAALIERDLDILGEMGRARLAMVAVSITSLKDEVKRTLEPRASSPARRLRVIRQLSEAGVPVMVLAAPVIPFVTDAELEDILEAARDTGALAAGYVMLRLPWEVKDLFRDWLDAHVPLKAAHVMSLVQQMRGGKDYDSAFGSRMRGEGPFAQLLARRFAAAHRRLGFGRLPPLDATAFVPPSRPSPQRDLFAPGPL